MKPNTKKDTKSAIMNSAEILMAEHGIDGVSLREILRNAHANPAALVYHFNSKDGLIAAILERHGHAIDVRRLELLRTLESADTPPTVVEVIDAAVDPLLEFLHEEGESGRRFLRFLARLQSDRTGIIQQTEREDFPEMNLRIGRVMTTACSHLSKEIGTGSLFVDRSSEFVFGSAVGRLIGLYGPDHQWYFKGGVICLELQG